MSEVWVAAIAAGGSAIIGGALSAGGAESAASTAANADTQAAQLQEQMYTTGAGLEAPSRNLGYSADNALASLYGFGSPYQGASSLGVPSIAGGVPGGYGGGSNGASVPGGYANLGTPTNGAAGGFAQGAFGQPGYANGSYYPTSAAQLKANSLTGNAGATPTGGGTMAPGSAGGTPNYSAFYNQPGYQFTLQQGENAVNRNAAANGGLYSANTMTQENNYAQGQASTQYGNYVNQLNSMAGLGQVATGQTVQAGTAAAEGASNSLISAGNAQASGVLGAAGGINNALTGNNGLIAALSGGGYGNPGGYGAGSSNLSTNSNGYTVNVDD
jgi:hypothetical protein